MAIWEDYAIQLHDAIDKNLLLQEPLVVMLTLGKIKDATDCYCLAVETVDEIIIDAPWSYDSCPNCTTIFDPSKCGSACRSCQKTLYKLNVRMEHNRDKGNFLFGDAICIKLFGKTAAECRDELIAAGDDIKEFPPRVDEILSKTWEIYIAIFGVLPLSVTTIAIAYNPFSVAVDGVHIIDRRSQYLTVNLRHNNLMPQHEVVFYYQPNQGIQLTEKETIHLCLTEIGNMLQANRRSLRDFPSMPYPIGYAPNQHHNKLIHNEMAYDKQMLVAEFNRTYHLLIDEQKSIVDTIIRVVDTQSTGVYFLYGYGGTGKTFVWTTLSSAIRSNGGIICTVASSGIASLLLPGGQTAHSKFAIPVPATQNSTCNIHQDSELAELLKVTKLIVWDEAPMCYKFAFEALDKSLKDIMHNNLPFGSKIVVFSGDF
ncbi:uncharacterized protein LOC114378805 [Glycine soja]|uniref:uncharacterized protein LOC114378805 n=1 Tax=Glycine soja TaxID=3848 RepID=UPI001039E53F|nr:uncharacterized protein LOC114378805 [Glycine soja]